MPRQDGLLTTEDAARVLRVTDSTIRRLCHSGVIRAERLGRDWYMRLADVESARARPGPGRPKQIPTTTPGGAGTQTAP